MLGSDQVWVMFESGLGRLRVMFGSGLSQVRVQVI